MKLRATLVFAAALASDWGALRDFSLTARSLRQLLAGPRRILNGVRGERVYGRSWADVDCRGNRRGLDMAPIDPGWFGALAVIGASAIMVWRPSRFFGRQLSLEEAISVCWVAWSIYMGMFVIYIGLKLPLGLSRNAHVPAVVVAACLSLPVVLWLTRIVTDWRSAVTRSIFGLFSLTLVVVSLTLVLVNSRN